MGSPLHMWLNSTPRPENGLTDHGLTHFLQWVLQDSAVFALLGFGVQGILSACCLVFGRCRV